MKNASEDLDLHGLTVEEAIPLVDTFLYESLKTGLHRVWVIHGRGTGALRRTVRYHLTNHPLVRSCTTAGKNHGGIGATQIELAD